MGYFHVIEYRVPTRLIASVGSKAPAEIVILRDGDTSMTGFGTVHLSYLNGYQIVKRFNDRGVQVPIDLEHATIRRGGQGLEAPAVGWITKLSYQHGRGLVAKIEWTPKGRSLIQTKKYKYFSPVLDLNSTTKDVIGLHSLALTNMPRTVGCSELLAASLNTLNGPKPKLRSAYKPPTRTPRELLIASYVKELSDNRDNPYVKNAKLTTWVNVSLDHDNHEKLTAKELEALI